MRDEQLADRSSQAVIEREWQNGTVFILGGGPSLGAVTQQELREIRECGRVIVINDSFRLMSDADCLYFCDAGWWVARRNDVQRSFSGRIITRNNYHLSRDGIISLRSTGVTGLETDPGALRHGHNSGYQAMGVAFHFGVCRIILLGYDMRVVQHRMHWHDLPTRITPVQFQQTLQYDMLPHFETLRVPLEQAGVEVINCTPGSALRVWPYQPLREVLEQSHERDFRLPSLQ